MENIVARVIQEKHIIKDNLPHKITKENLFKPQEKEVFLITNNSLLKDDNLFFKKNKKYLRPIEL